ncbi:ATP-binding protein [Streptosporangiaceae bacterium NEAU-GS5]|nr:ATP-binding protein [Streptosporangiaceae bacterium NEAU-GS5]
MPEHGVHVMGDGAISAHRGVRLPTVPSDSLFRAITFPPVPRAVRNARTWVKETASRWGVTAREEDIVLTTSELVTNAIRHAEDGGSVTLLMMYAADVLRLEVRDQDPLNMPLVQAPEPTETNGWGLLVVGQCAERWGVRVSESGKTVWAEFDIPRAPSNRWRPSPSPEEGGADD